MRFKDQAARILNEIGQEAKNKLPRVVSEARQQILENLPLWDQGHAVRAQATQQATDIHGKSMEQNIKELKADMADMKTKYKETRDMLNKHFGPKRETDASRGRNARQDAPKEGESQQRKPPAAKA